MGLYIGQDEKRSELQSKIIADLQEKSRTNSLLEGDSDYRDSRSLENQHETRAAGVIIGLLIIVLIVVVIFIVARSR